MGLGESSRRLTIAEVAERAALDRMTVSRAERGDNPTLLTVVRILRVLRRVEALDAFLPPVQISLMEVIRRAERAS